MWGTLNHQNNDFDPEETRISFQMNNEPRIDLGAPRKVLPNQPATEGTNPAGNKEK